MLLMNELEHSGMDSIAGAWRLPGEEHFAIDLPITGHRVTLPGLETPGGGRSGEAKIDKITIARFYLQSMLAVLPSLGIENGEILAWYLIREMSFPYPTSVILTAPQIDPTLPPTINLPGSGIQIRVHRGMLQAILELDRKRRHCQIDYQRQPSS